MVTALLLAGLAAFVAIPDGSNNSGAFDNCPIYPLVNRLGIATVIVGVLGLSMATSVILIIYAHRKDQGALRERIILGLTIASAMYSVRQRRHHFDPFSRISHIHFTL
jgi:hypothetical protein